MDLHTLLTGEGTAAAPQRTPVPKRASVANLMNDQDVDINASTASAASSRRPSVQTKPVPKRYATPPVWAQTWVTVVKRPAAVARPPPLAPRLFYEPSIAGTVPYEDLTRRVSKWIYALLHQEVEPDQYQYVEIEFKFGRILHRETERRISLPTTTECAVTLDHDYTFVPGVEEHMFATIHTFLKELARPHGGRKPPFRTTESRTDDYAYTAPAERHQTQGIPRNIRVSKDQDTQRSTAIHKNRIRDLYVHMPNEPVDLKFLMLLELPANMDGDRLRVFEENERPHSVRRKHRFSYIHQGTCSQVDLTKVVDGMVQGARPTYEVECELMTPELVGVYQRLIAEAERGVGGDAGVAYEELVKCFVDNARVMARKFTRIA